MITRQKPLRRVANQLSRCFQGVAASDVTPTLDLGQPMGRLGSGPSLPSEALKSVILEEAEIQSRLSPQHLALIKEWMPAFARMAQRETGPLPPADMMICAAPVDALAGSRPMRISGWRTNEGASVATLAVSKCHGQMECFTNHTATAEVKCDVKRGRDYSSPVRRDRTRASR